MSRHRNRRNTIWIGATNDALFYSITLIVFLSQQAVASLVSTLVVGMGYLPMLLPRDGVHYFNDGSSYINNDMRKNDNMINVHFGVGTAFALDTNDGGGKSVSKTTTTTAFARGYPRTDTLIENIAEERNLVVQLDNPIRSVVSQSTTSAPDLKVVMNENQSTQANLGADESLPLKPDVPPLPKDTRNKLESRIQQRVDPSLQAIVNKALTSDSMIAKGASKATMVLTEKYDGVVEKPNSNALTKTVGKQTTSIVSLENCNESPHTSFVDAISGVFNNAIIFAFGVGVGIVSFITREKMSVGVADTSSDAVTSNSLPNENDEGETANSIVTFGGSSASYLDGLSGSQPFEFTEDQVR